MKCQKLFLIALSLYASSLYTLEQPEMIVFIHGTVKPVEFSFSNLYKIMRNKIENSVYIQAAAQVRKDPFFYQGQPMQQLGLHPITTESPSPAALSFTHLYNKQYDHLYKNNSKRLYYTYGWTGLLSIRKRYEAAQELYADLSKEIKRLHSEGVYPTLSLYSYSYGANVALNLAAVKDDNPKLDPNAFTVDKLIMFGAPIQRATDYLVSNPIFKKVYHFYSQEDSIQTLDVFSSREFFIKNRFSNRSKFSVPNKVIQVRVRFTKSLCGLNRIKNMPSEPYKLLADRRLRKRHRDSGHAELWNLKWGTYWYGSSFPLNPLPVASLAPSFIHAIDTHAPTRQHLTLDYSKTQSGALLSGRLKHFRKAVPILTPQLTEELYTLAHRFKPKAFTVDNQLTKTRAILKKIKKGIKKGSPYRKSRLLTAYLKPNNIPQFKKIRHGHLLGTKL
ncbi:MAG: hypothetical protein ACJAZS_000832 [Alteromonas naphthalenivorans]|jgi:hypothetical protein